MSLYLSLPFWPPASRTGERYRLDEVVSQHAPQWVLYREGDIAVIAGMTMS